MAKMIVGKINKYEVLIDDEDLEKLSKYKWKGYKHHRSGKIYIRDMYMTYMHRVIMNVTDTKIQVDHKNGNPLDNRKENLRICPRGGMNAINRPKQKNNTTGYKGVTKSKRHKSKPYIAWINVKQKKKYLGLHATAEDAAKAYNEAALKYFGEFAYLNEIKEVEKNNEG